MGALDAQLDGTLGRLRELGEHVEWVRGLLRAGGAAEGDPVDEGASDDEVDDALRSFAQVARSRARARALSRSTRTLRL